MIRCIGLALFSLLLISCDTTPVGDQLPPPGDDPPTPRADYWVDPSGSDSEGDGSPSSPWATLGHALSTVPAAGGFTVTLRDGIYEGSNTIQRGFDATVLVRAENAYGATLRHITGNETVLYLAHQGPVRVEFEGLVFSNEGSTANPCAVAAGFLIHLTNVTHVTFRNNIVLGNDRMPRCNETIKINLDNARHFPESIRFERNFFSTPPAVTDRAMIDVFEPGELEIIDNIFVSDRGRTGGEGFVHLWGEWGTEPQLEPRYHIARNVFLNYQGEANKGFIVFGGEGTSLPEVSDALIENNLFIDTSMEPMLAPVVMEGVRDITLRANTFVGDFPADGFMLALGAIGSNQPSSGVRITDNLCWDPLGTMSQLVTVTGAIDAESITLDNNTVWNDGREIPQDGPVGVSLDANLDQRDPRLPTDPSGMSPPRWDAASGRFASGSTTVAEEFERLVRAFGAIGADSPARDAANPSRMPLVDILGLPRDAQPDVGAFEVR